MGQISHLTRRPHLPSAGNLSNLCPPRWGPTGEVSPGWRTFGGGGSTASRVNECATKRASLVFKSRDGICGSTTDGLRNGPIPLSDGDTERMTHRTGPWPVSAALRPWQAEALAAYQASE